MAEARQQGQIDLALRRILEDRCNSCRDCQREPNIMCEEHGSLAEDIKSEFVRAQMADDPAFDCTDAAHPAWWRGQEYGAAAIVREVSSILDGTHDASGTANEPWESTRRRLLGMVASSRGRTTEPYCGNHHPHCEDGHPECPCSCHRASREKASR